MVRSRKNAEARLPARPRQEQGPPPIQITAEQILREARELRDREIRPPKREIAGPTSSPSTASAGARSSRRPPPRALERLRVGQVRAVGGVPGRLPPRPLRVGARPRRRLPQPHPLARVRRVRDAQPLRQPRPQRLGPRRLPPPRVDQLWYKYIHMEEMLRNVPAARQVFERWMQWQPDAQGWLSYVKFELRYGEVARARAVYERAGDLLSEDEDAQKLFAAFAEERC
uniref:Crooked neck-like protein 1 n=1 Tax=Ananas comosus var. bracteatus TaxID=296719 RepID=A0A6V7QK68_ANACO|nr:unnamed protein product [Ananas comosus var. bracteatus]